MAYAIARLRKLKQDNVASSWMHVSRERTTLNANPQIPNVRLLDTGDPKQSLPEVVMATIAANPQKRKIRTDAVYCVELLLTASPSYFRPDAPLKYGHYQQQRLDDWVDANLKWLAQEYGDRIVRAELHLDEATPHLHAFLVPLDDEGQLNCKSIFGGREKMRAFQDSYHKAVKHLKLERGIRGSQANHEDIKDFYEVVNRGVDLGVELPIDVLQAKAADRDRAMIECEEMERTAKVLERENALLQERIQTLEAENLRYRAEGGRWKQQYQDMVAGLRSIPLEQVALELGLEPDAQDTKKWKGAGHIFSINGTKFYDFLANEGGGGTIDLVMAVESYDYKQAIAWLNDRFGEAVMLQASMDHAQHIVETTPPPQFVPPLRDEEKWPSVRKYLTEQRYLPGATIDLLHQQGLLYADSRQNAVFLRRALNGQQVTGASLRGTYGEGNSFIGLAKGSKRDGGWFYLIEGTGKTVQRVVLVESPIDAISQRVLDQGPGRNTRKTMYLAADGVSELLLEQLRQVPEVIVVFDNNSAGEQLAQKVLQHLPQAIRYMLQGKDSNDALGKEWDDIAAQVAQVFPELQAQVDRQKAIKQKRQRSAELEQ